VGDGESLSSLACDPKGARDPRFLIFIIKIRLLRNKKAGLLRKERTTLRILLILNKIILRDKKGGRLLLPLLSR
jgi:hypothetical protein